MGVDIVVMEDCASNYGIFRVPGSKPDTSYRVELSGSEGPAYCPCKAYSFSPEPKDCKHIRWLWKNACLYNPQWHDGQEHPTTRPIEYTYDAWGPGRCPACGGPTVLVRRAV